MNALVREPAVAGRFYPGDAKQLERWLRSSLEPGVRASRHVGLIGPHAGYVYSGQIAAITWARVKVPESVILLCPNHTGLGARRAVWPAGSWRIPGASLEVDTTLVEALVNRGALAPDREAHRFEHAIEVHLPFVHARRSDVKIVPVCLGRLSLEECRALGNDIATVAQGAGGSARVLIAASTDMSHYVSAEQAERLDRMALERIERIDSDGLYEVVTQHEISMCGFVPTTVALTAARALGARSAEIVRYGNSGEASGDLTRVVGYAGVLLC